MEIIATPAWEFSWEWLVNLIKRILADVFGFIYESEGWTEEVTE